MFEVDQIVKASLGEGFVFKGKILRMYEIPPVFIVLNLDNGEEYNINASSVEPWVDGDE